MADPLQCEDDRRQDEKDHDHGRDPLQQKLGQIAHAPSPVASAMASPDMLAPGASRNTAIPVITGTHHCWRRNCNPRAAMAPNSGAGAGAPSPRNDSPARVTTRFPTSRLAVTMMAGIA